MNDSRNFHLPRWWVLLVIAAFLMSCLAGPSITATAPVISPTEEPTQMEEPPPPTEAVPTETPSSVDSLSEQGPWLIYVTEEGLIIVNSDGSGRTRLMPPPIPRSAVKTLDLPNGASPKGGMLAVRTQATEGRGLNLTLIHLPDREVRFSTPLLSPELESQIQPPTLTEFEKAISERDALRWSPDGRYLAFVAGLDGPSTDLYVYNNQDRTIARLTDGPNQAATPFWSLDGQWIIHQAVEAFGTGAGWSAEAVWAAAVDGSEVRKVYDVPETSGQEIFLGITMSNDLLVQRWSQLAPSLLKINLDTGDTIPLYDGIPDSVALDPQSGAVAIHDDQGLKLLSPSGDELPLASVGEWDHVTWAHGINRFLVGGPSGLASISIFGEEAQIADHYSLPSPSPDGGWIASSNDTLNLYTASFLKAAEIQSGPGAHLLWRPDSAGLYFIDSKDLYYVDFLDFQPRYIEGGLIYGLYPTLQGVGWVEGEERGLDLGSGLKLISRERDESLLDPEVSITAQEPYLLGSDHESASLFNQIAHNLMTLEIERFKELVAQDPDKVSNYFFDARFEVTSGASRVISVLFEVMIYTGGAHPGTYHPVLNFDLNTSTHLELSDLFRPDAPYLESIADLCIAELNKRAEMLFPDFEESASAQPENYRVWNLGPLGMLVTFEEYQVAAYAAGPQRVLIPFSSLVDIIDPSGPLAAHGP